MAPCGARARGPPSPDRHPRLTPRDSCRGGELCAVPLTRTPSQPCTLSTNCVPRWERALSRLKVAMGHMSPSQQPPTGVLAGQGRVQTQAQSISTSDFGCVPQRRLIWAAQCGRRSAGSSQDVLGLCPGPPHGVCRCLGAQQVFRAAPAKAGEALETGFSPRGALGAQGSAGLGRGAGLILRTLGSPAGTALRTRHLTERKGSHRAPRLSPTPLYPGFLSGGPKQARKPYSCVAGADSARSTRWGPRQHSGRVTAPRTSPVTPRLGTPSRS